MDLAVEEQRQRLRYMTMTAQQPLRVLLVAALDGGPTGAAAAMLRSLTGLGHHVFHLDPAHHGSLLREPGGWGTGTPVRVDLSRLEPALARFRPHVMVLCGDGLALGPGDAQELRRRGVVSVAMTMAEPGSDPADGDAASAPDVRTVPSPAALQAYRGISADRCRVFAPGVDRDTVVSHVPAAPDLRCDVAFVGDATGRPDLRTAASHLARDVVVRCYGPGWAPGSSAPQGLGLLQALREATVHVPVVAPGGTVAPQVAMTGLAVGGVLALPAHLRPGVLGPDEALTHADDDDIVDAVLEGLAQPERLERVRRASFHRLVTEHLYEHRWLALLDDVAGRLDPEPLGRPRTVALSGWFGAGNTGDDLILEAVARAIETTVPDAHVVVAGVQPRRVADQHGLPAIRRTDLRAADDLARRCAAVVQGGGGLWHDYSFATNGGTAGTFASAQGSPSSQSALPLMVRMYGGTFHVFGMGVGPLDDPDAQAVVRFLAGHAESVTVRDACSRDTLLGIPGWCTDVRVAPDCVYALELSPELPVPRLPTEGGAPLIAVNVRDWSVPVEPSVLDALPGALSELAARHGAELVGLPMMAADKDRLRRLFSRVDAPTRVLGRSADIDTLIADLRQCRLLVSMRLHGALLGHRAGIPVVGLGYDPKVHHHFTQVGRAAFVLGLSAGAADLEALLARAFDEEGRLPPDVVTTVAALEREAAAALAALARRIGATSPTPPRPAAIPFLGPAVPHVPEGQPPTPEPPRPGRRGVLRRLAGRGGG